MTDNANNSEPSDASYSSLKKINEYWASSFSPNSDTTLEASAPSRLSSDNKTTIIDCDGANNKMCGSSTNEGTNLYGLNVWLY